MVLISKPAEYQSFRIAIDHESTRTLAHDANGVPWRPGKRRDRKRMIAILRAPVRVRLIVRSGKSRQPITNFFQRIVLKRRWLTFITMCAAFAVFGAGSVNLFNMFRANFNLIADYGFMALADGAAQQFGELLVNLLLAMVAYIVFKACEYRLVHQLTDIHSEDDIP